MRPSTATAPTGPAITGLQVDLDDRRVRDEQVADRDDDVRERPHRDARAGRGRHRAAPAPREALEAPGHDLVHGDRGQQHRDVVEHLGEDPAQPHEHGRTEHRVAARRPRSARCRPAPSAPRGARERAMPCPGRGRRELADGGPDRRLVREPEAPPRRPRVLCARPVGVELQRDRPAAERRATPRRAASAPSSAATAAPVGVTGSPAAREPLEALALGQGDAAGRARRLARRADRASSSAPHGVRLGGQRRPLGRAADPSPSRARPGAAPTRRAGAIAAKASTRAAEHRHPAGRIERRLDLLADVARGERHVDRQQVRPVARSPRSAPCSTVARHLDLGRAGRGTGESWTIASTS